jgi:hypothetical protein
MIFSLAGHASFMHLSLIDEIAFWCAVVPSALFCWNLFFFRRPPQRVPAHHLPHMSVLIPARNEESNIAAAVEGVLASCGVELELIVLDDASTDGTAAIVHSIAARDSRVRCVSAPSLSAGWAGKAHAAHALSRLAIHDVFCFLDADVRIAPDTLSRMYTFMWKTHSALVSGFPEEITVTPLEWLLLPLIQFLLLGYLPFVGLRFTSLPAFGAGCGQFLMMSREGYEKTGGYASVRTTMHDGIMLSKLFRRHQLHTDVADLTGLASCRMYRSGNEVWNGLTKNATEGIAAPARILPFTLLLFCGQVLPWLLLCDAVMSRNLPRVAMVAATCVVSLLPRLVSIVRFHQKAVGALLHPIGVSVFLILQWAALSRRLRGTPAIWKGRAFEVG